jgi:hypothetical protein
MIVCYVVGFFAVLSAVSAISTIALGLDTDGLQYDWRTERWIFVPDRHDLILEMLIKS